MILNKHWVEPIWWVVSRYEDEIPQIEFGPILNCADALIKMRELRSGDTSKTEYSIADIRFIPDFLGE